MIQRPELKKKEINAHQINFTVGNQSYNKTKKKLCLFVYNLAIKYMGGSDLEYCEVYLKSVDIRGYLDDPWPYLKVMHV